MGKRSALVAFLLCLAPVTASAQQAPCGPTEAVEKRIHDQFGETIVGAGVVAGGILFTLANPDTGTFTVLIRRPIDNVTCIVMSGTGWTSVEPQQPGTNL